MGRVKQVGRAGLSRLGDDLLVWHTPPEQRMIALTDVIGDFQSAHYASQMPTDILIADELGQDVSQRLHLSTAQEQEPLSLGVHEQPVSHLVTLAVVSAEKRRRSPATDLSS